MNELLYWVLLGVLGTSFVSIWVAWLVFRLTSIRRIEALVRAEGRDRTQWDGIGLRVGWYALVICLPIPKENLANNPLIDGEAVRRYATSRDKRLGAWLLLSLGTFTLTGFTLMWGS
jgi:hypothetical protein